MDTKTTSHEKMSAAWSAASSDLGFEFEAPHAFVDAEGIQYSCLGRVVHFGCTQGTLVVSGEEEEQVARRVGSQLGYYTSVLDPADYQDYDRSRFIETLADWGYYGPPERCPDWYAEASAEVLA